MNRIFREIGKKIFICLLAAYIGYIIPQITMNVQDWSEIFKVKENLQVNINNKVYGFFYLGISFILFYLGFVYKPYQSFLKIKFNEINRLIFCSICIRSFFVGMNIQTFEYSSYNIIEVILILMILSLTVISEQKDEDEDEDNDDLTIKTIYQSRLGIKSEFRNFLEKNNPKNKDLLLIDGRWGIGKTTLVNLTLDELKNEKINIYKNIIKVDAMSLLNKNTLLKEVFQHIEEILKRDGINVDLWKDYKKIIYGLKENSPINFEFYKKDFSSFKNNLFSIMINYGKKIHVIVDNLERIFLEEYLLEILGFFHEISQISNIEVVVLSDLERMKLPQGINKIYFDKIFTKKIYLDIVDLKEVIGELNKGKKIINLKPDNILEISNLLDKIFCFETLKNDVERVMKNISLNMEKGTYDSSIIKQKLEDFKEFTSIPRDIKLVYKKVSDMKAIKNPRIFLFYLLEHFFKEEEIRWIKRTGDIKNLNRNYIDKNDDNIILLNLIIERLSTEKNGWEFYFYLKKIFTNESININSIESIDKNQNEVMEKKKELKNIEDYIFLKGYTHQLDTYFETFFKNDGYKLLMNEIRPEIIELLLKITNLNIKLFNYEKNFLVRSVMDYYRKDIIKYEEIVYIFTGTSINSLEFWNSTRTYDNYIEILSNTGDFKEILEMNKNHFGIIESTPKEIMNNFFNIVQKEKLKEFGLELNSNILKCQKLIKNILILEEVTEENQRNIKNEFESTSAFYNSMELYLEDKSLLVSKLARKKVLDLCKENIGIFLTDIMSNTISNKMSKELKALKMNDARTIPEAVFLRFNNTDVNEEESKLFRFLIKEFYLDILCTVYQWGLTFNDIPNYLFEEIEELKWVKESLLDGGRRKVLIDIFYEHFYVLKKDEKNPPNLILNRNYKNFKLRYGIEIEKEDVIKEVEKIFFKKEASILAKWKDRPQSLVKYMNENSKKTLYWNIEYLRKLLLEEIYILPIYQEYISNAVKNGEKAFEIYEKKDNIESITEDQKSNIKDWMIFFENARYSRSFFLSTKEKGLLDLINKSMEPDQNMFFYKLSRT